MSDGISDGMFGHRDWQTLWNDWNHERQEAERLYRAVTDLRAALQAADARAAAAEAELSTARAAVAAYRMDAEQADRQRAAAEDALREAAETLRKLSDMHHIHYSPPCRCMWCVMARGAHRVAASALAVSPGSAAAAEGER